MFNANISHLDATALSPVNQAAVVGRAQGQIQNFSMKDQE